MKAEYIYKYALAKITSTWFLEILGIKAMSKGVGLGFSDSV